MDSQPLILRPLRMVPEATDSQPLILAGDGSSQATEEQCALATDIVNLLKEHSSGGSPASGRIV